MSQYGELFTARKRIMDGMVRKSILCCVGIPVSFVLSMGLMIAYGFARYWYFALACTVLLTVLFIRGNQRFRARGGNAPELAPYVLPTAVASKDEARGILARHAVLFETANNCAYCYIKRERPIRFLLLSPETFEEDAYRETYQEAICQILEGPNLPSEVRSDKGHSELRIHLILADQDSPALAHCMSRNAYHTMAVREGAMTAALILSEQKLVVSAFFGDHYGDAKKYDCGCALLSELFAG
ncbi:MULTISPECIES: hypothetical protein [Anaerotruncus]|uniref:hypothetical protein n=1 Tax=Anaerotruncus TaxID=244127 RepID=UPI000E4AECE4|nr:MULTISPECIES: hypothetical protein [Anaerotruncus]RGX55186.1 hypothetical protein DWV16_10510 [Anaerotruncus sp. AF02-27]